MTDLVEIVARAIYGQSYEVVCGGPPHLSDSAWKEYDVEAQAALAAIKASGFSVVSVVPTEAMVEAFWRNHPSPYETDMENEDAAKLCITAVIQAATPAQGRQP